MVRSAAKNHKDVAIVVKSSDYDAIIKEMDANEGSLTLATRFDLAIKALVMRTRRRQSLSPSL